MRGGSGPHLPRPRHATGLLAAAVLVVAVISGCGTDSAGPPTGSGSSTRTTAHAPVPHPTGPSELILRVSTGAGLMPPLQAFSQLPSYSLMGDGGSITPGPVIEIYPPPALPNLQAAIVTEEGIQKILQAAEEAGLTTPGVDFGVPPVADAPATTFTVAANGTTTITVVPALHIGGADQPGLTPQQVEARQAVLDFEAKLGDLPTLLGSDIGTQTAYSPEAMAILAVPADRVPPDPSGLEPGRLNWPLANLSDLGQPQPGPYRGARKLEVSGPDLETLLPLAQQATTLTLWESGGTMYRLSFRPWLPDEVPTV